LGADYTHATGPNSRTPDCATDTPEQGNNAYNLFGSGLFAARSRHAGIVHVIAADGSGYAVRQTIGLAVWRSLGTRSGNEAGAAFP